MSKIKTQMYNNNYTIIICILYSYTPIYIIIMSCSNILKINNSVPQNRCQITKLIIISLVTKIHVLKDII